ncbi:hypothetical protein GS601_02015 [Myxacorys almedinensis A]|uniref:SCP domain-containing protein n=2 Tax=Myxacorys TaxID=2056239 RepID=A0A8J8CI35_9CYAN|nr:hypothetical protein [Myxacorys almedinensis A]
MFRFFNTSEQLLQTLEATNLSTQPTTLNANQFEQTASRSLSSDPNAGFNNFEQQVVELTNQERIGRGLTPLAINLTLNNVAEQHSQDMLAQNYFSHQGKDGSLPWERMQGQGYAYSRAAENIAFGQTTPQQVVSDWMNSPGHRKNILDPNLQDIGVGYYNGYWTQNFGTAIA